MNNKSFQHFCKRIGNERGSMAIMLVLSAVALVTPFVVNFTYDTNINKLKVYNMEDRAKARLTAESGLQFAMARLRLYKEAFNFTQKSKDAAKAVKQEMLDVIWNFPFVYPIPILKNMNAIQRQAISDFQEETFLEGSMQLTIQNISNRINLNALRLSLITDAIKESQLTEEEIKKAKEENDTDEVSEFNVESQLFKILTDTIERESLASETFDDKYSNLEVNKLINELKYYISDPNSIEDPAGGDENFQSAEYNPKHAPLNSFSEVFALPEWPDDISNLIKREFTVHGAIMIDLNKMTDKLLNILIPDITKEDITEFFEYKDNPEDPKFFNSLEDFKNYIVGTANIMTDSDFDERFAKYQAQGLQFGPTPTLFKIQSISTVGRGKYTIDAYVVIPATPRPRIEKKEEKEKPNTTSATGGTTTNPVDPPPTTKDAGKNKEEQKTILLEPRIVEISVS